MTTIDDADHERIVCIGDTHGDLLGLVHALKAAGLIWCGPGFVDRASACHVGRGRPGVAAAPVTVDARSVGWSGKTACVLLLGDTVDNQRGDDPSGRCALPATQQTLLALLRHLHEQARAAGGRVALVLGNHEVMNIVAPNQERACHALFPSHFVYRRRPQPLCVANAHGRLETDPRWRRILLDALAALDARAVVLIVRGADVVAVCVHGFLDDACCAALGLAPVRARGKERRRQQAIANADAINRLYDDALRHRRGRVFDAIMGRRDSAVAADRLPTWCRASPATLKALPAAARRFFACSTIVKGHDVQPGGEPVVHTMRDGAEAVVFTDVGMSRSMRPASAKRAPVAYSTYEDGKWTSRAWTVRAWPTIEHPA